MASAPNTQYLYRELCAMEARLNMGWWVLYWTNGGDGTVTASALSGRDYVLDATDGSTVDCGWVTLQGNDAVFTFLDGVGTEPVLHSLVAQGSCLRWEPALYRGAVCLLRGCGMLSMSDVVWRVRTHKSILT